MMVSGNWAEATIGTENPSASQRVNNVCFQVLFMLSSPV